MIRAALLACCTAAAVRINCTVAVPRRIRAGDRVAARVDVNVAGAAAESLVVELRAAGPVVFGPGAPGLDPPGDAGDDDVIYAVRGERRRRWLVRLGARGHGARVQCRIADVTGVLSAPGSNSASGTIEMSMPAALSLSSALGPADGAAAGTTAPGAPDDDMTTVTAAAPTAGNAGSSLPGTPVPVAPSMLPRSAAVDGT